MGKFWLDYKDIYEDLQNVKNIILETNYTSEKYLNDSIDYLGESGGKMLRPAFLIIGSLFGNKEVEKDSIINLAAAVEMMHLATLVHDDIIDESFLRRGKETIQSKYSKEYAVYMGDYLLSQCFLMLVDYDLDPQLVKILAKGIKKICTSEMMQNHLRYNNNVTKSQYLKIITGKTAVLFAVSFIAGASYSGANEETLKRLGRIGLNIGRAFQLIDDLLDYTGDIETIGKDSQADLLKGYYTLPIILGLNSKYRKEIETVLNKKTFTDDDIKILINCAHKSGAITETKKLAIRYTEKAIKDINSLPENRGKEILLDVVPKLLERIY